LKKDILLERIGFPRQTVLFHAFGQGAFVAEAFFEVLVAGPARDDHKRWDLGHFLFEVFLDRGVIEHLAGEDIEEDVTGGQVVMEAEMVSAIMVTPDCNWIFHWRHKCVCG
jgi:hypothetical protein